SGGTIVVGSATAPLAPPIGAQGTSFAALGQAQMAAVSATMQAMAAQSAAQTASLANPGIMNDVLLMMKHPVESYLGYLTGLAHGGAMLANQFTGERIGPLNNYVNNLTNENGGAYYAANMAAMVGAQAATTAAGMGPCSKLANAMKAMDAAVTALQLKNQLQNDEWANSGM